MKHQTEQHLIAHGIRPTAVRIIVWEKAASLTEPFTLADMERWLCHSDRSSIFRALRLFAEHSLLHIIDDGSGQQKYCVCRCDTPHHVNHLHFTCTQCGKTTCLTGYTIPPVTLPHGYLMQEAEYIIKGVCPLCSAEKNIT